MTGASALAVLLDVHEGELNLIDVGARWGTNERWNALGERARILGFDPDPEECARLNEAAPPNVRYVPVGLLDRNGTADLHVTEQPACSSLYPPVRLLYEQYGCVEFMRPARVVSIPVRRLDDLEEARSFRPLSALKLDTQGSELDILRGAETLLADCGLIDIEVEFNPLYEGQPLFCDIDRFLRDRGFVLWRLENLVHYAPENVPAAHVPGFLLAADPAPLGFGTSGNGQLFWTQAQYVRAEYPRTGARTMPLDKAMRPAIVAGAYGFWDLALELIGKTGETELLGRLREALSAS